MKNLFTISFLFLAALFCLYPWQELVIAGGLGFIRNNVSWVILIVLALLFSWRALSQKHLSQAHYSIPKFWLVGLLGWGIACVPFLLTGNQFVENSFWLPFGLFLAWLFLLSVLNNQSFLEHKKLLLFFIVAVCSIQVLIALWQLFHSYMMEATGGISEHKLPKVKGTFNQRNLYASFVASALACAFYLFPTNKPLKLYKKSIQISQQNRLLLAFILLASFTLILTDSRVGIYAFIACYLLLAVSKLKLWREQLLKPTVIVIVAVIASQLVTNLIYNNKTKDFSRTAGRQVIYHTSIEAIKDKPILGHGLGSFETTYLEKLSDLAEKRDIEHNELMGRPQNLSHPHNEFLYWGIQGGLVSVLGLLIMVVSVLSLFRHTSIKRALGYFALLFPISFHLMVELPFYISMVHLIVFGLLVAFVISSIGAFNSYKISIKRSRVIKSVNSLIAGVLIFALLINIYSLSKAFKFERALNPELSDLDSVILTLGWNDTYQSLRLRYEANRAAKLNLLEPQVEYLNWLEKQIKITPRLNYYFNLYAVNRYLGNESKAKFYYDEVKRLFVGVKEAENWLEANRISLINGGLDVRP